MASDPGSLLRRGSRSAARGATRLDAWIVGGKGGAWRKGRRIGSRRRFIVAEIEPLRFGTPSLAGGLFFVWIKIAGLIHKIAPNSPCSKTKCSQLLNYHQTIKVRVMTLFLTIGMKLDQGKNQM